MALKLRIIISISREVYGDDHGMYMQVKSITLCSGSCGYAIGYGLLVLTNYALGHITFYVEGWFEFNIPTSFK